MICWLTLKQKQKKKKNTLVWHSLKLIQIKPTEVTCSTKQIKKSLIFDKYGHYTDHIYETMTQKIIHSADAVTALFPQSFYHFVVHVQWQ